jgi:ferredoxin
MNCIEACSTNAIVFTSKKIKTKKAAKPENVIAFSKNDSTRRIFLSVSALFAASALAKAQEKLVGDGGYADITDKKSPERLTPLVPPGSKGIKEFKKHCTACQLCVTSCPNGVLRPSEDLMTLMQPAMSYDRGYCRPECVKCSEVCPTKAISKITKDDKSSLQIGHAIWNKDLCLIYKDEVACNRCNDSCPTGAINLIPSDPADKNSFKIVVVDIEHCIGCGACENLCPSRPFSAIHVEGHERHKFI